MPERRNLIITSLEIGVITLLKTEIVILIG